MYYGYILKSLRDSTFYTGHTDDLRQRVEDHNKGLSKYTRPRRPWQLVYAQEFSTRAEAMKWERELKRRKDRSYIEKLVKNWRPRS